MHNKGLLFKALAITACAWLCGGVQLASATPDQEEAATTDACSIPTTPSSSHEETAWRIFVAINCMQKNGKLTWETWQTQACLDNSNDCRTTGRFHHSMLRDAITKADATEHTKRTGSCSPMTTKATATGKGLNLEPFVPDNLSDNPEFCEEVVINPSEEAYAHSNGLLSVDGQINYLQSGKTIQFPKGAIEVKGDWVSASSYKGVTFDCSKKNPKIYTENIDGTCFALVGMHISSKLYPKWIWSTFEPQYPATNPNRCNKDLYNECIDPWGSNPATTSIITTKGHKTIAETKPTAALDRLFNSAGKALDPSFQNYRLTGVQTDYDEPKASKGQLGNSFVEFNAQVPAQQASCITCHSYAQRNKTGGTPPGGAPSGAAAVGSPSMLIGYKPLDFSWFLGLGVPQQSPQNK